MEDEVPPHAVIELCVIVCSLKLKYAPIIFTVPWMHMIPEMYVQKQLDVTPYVVPFQSIVYFNHIIHVIYKELPHLHPLPPLPFL